MERLALTPQEVALALGISRSQVYNLMSRGDLPSIQIGTSRRVSVAALKRWIAELEGDTQDMITGLEEALHMHNVHVSSGR